jgi:hypothetical protein
MLYRDFTIEEILDVRDFKGAWDKAREAKNNKTYFTARVSPTKQGIDVANRAYEKLLEKNKKKYVLCKSF